MSAGIVFHLLAALAYAVLAVSLWRPLARGGEQAHTGKVGRICLLSAIILHGIALHQAILTDNGLRLSWALGLSAAIWVGMIIFWLESLILRIDGLLLILLPAVTLVTVVAAAFPQGYVVAHAHNDWLRVHLLIALTAYGLITVAALHAILMTALDRHLHRPVEQEASRGIISRAFDSMPPLLVQEHLLFRLIWIGFIVLTLAVGSGAMVSIALTGRPFPLDHKTVFTLLSWITFGGLLIGRYARGWRGRIALRWTLVGFVFLLLAYTGSRFVLEVILQRG
ncbi:cytochrome c biogenesis protein CcsA [Candidimonas humi]|uniref:Inner membrane protein YpjD n=1 Tax=Candidimonas humi TaxID=683355 RepID=A0ABV8NYG5_9BURK|nr:cytochrome c biogenesis protein CcsA [Candidimonas humi]MBV6306259.1 cytochrome c biogenesis protein CcsA [Candidimonas humi]